MKGTYVPKYYDENALDGAQQIAGTDTSEPTWTDEPAQAPEPTADPVPAATDTPPVEIPQMGEPAAPQPTFDDTFKERLGFSIAEVESILGEVETLKKRTFVEDPELVADDEFLKNLIRTYKRDGNILEFVEATQTDYKNMSAEEIVKYDIRKAEPGIPEYLVNRKYARIREDLGWNEALESGTPEERDFNEAMNWQANKLREKYVEQGKKFAVPERKIPESQPSHDQAKMDAAKAAVDNFMASAPVKEFLSSKSLQYGDFVFATDPNEVLDLIQDPVKLYKKFENPDGTHDAQKFLKWYALAPDPDKPFQLASASSKAKGELEIIKEIKNPSDDTPKQPVLNGKKTLTWGV